LYSSIRWVDWDSGKGSFPDTTVYGDPNCNLAVATYYDSSSVWAYNRRQGAQVDKDGYVYWQDKTVGGSWQWDNNRELKNARKKKKERQMLKP
jgi:hypothetical protein